MARKDREGKKMMSANEIVDYGEWVVRAPRIFPLSEFDRRRLIDYIEANYDHERKSHGDPRVSELRYQFNGGIVSIRRKFERSVNWELRIGNGVGVGNAKRLLEIIGESLSTKKEVVA